MHPDRDVLYGAVSISAGIVSLSGNLFFIAQVRKVSNLWYLGIPHAFVLCILCGTGPFFFSEGGIILDFLWVSQALLSMTSVGVFLSFPDSLRKNTRPFALLSGIIGIYAVISIYFLLRGILSPPSTSWNVVILMMALYWIFFLPIIGLCYIAAALWPRE
ncbi:MAG: hypothetical protein LUQ25_00155 [Methanoregulaceae archaeon]|nr:hypothetical protein [Methanoregulaceae archaeon]